MSLSDVIWSMVVFFFWFMLIWMFIAVFSDIFRRNDVSGLGKAGWTILIVVLPLLGILVYLIGRPRMTEQDRQIASEELARRRRLEGYSAADEVAKIATLRDEGRISADEYTELKSRAML